MSFLTPPIERLGGDGRFEPVRPGSAWRRPTVLLARELCCFEPFEAGAALGSAAMAAARLRARTAAPFVDAGVLAHRRGGRIGLWWWDMAVVGPTLAARFGEAPVQLAPETLAQPPGDGWRIVRTGAGWEAQVWRDGALLASEWRSQRYDAASWVAFTRVLGPLALSAPELPPPPETLPLSAPGRLHGLGLQDLSAAELGAGLGGLLALAMVLGAAFLLGQGLQLRSLAAAAEAEASRQGAMLQPRTPADVAAVRRLAAYRALADRPDPLPALARALTVLREHGVKPESLEAGPGAISVAIAYRDIGRAESIAQALQATGDYAEVRPMADAAGATIRLDLRLRTPPPAF